MGWAPANAEMATGLASAASGQMPQTLTLWPLPCPGAHKASPAALHPHTTGQLLTPLERQQEQRGSPAAQHAACRSLEETHRERVGLGPRHQGALSILPLVPIPPLEDLPQLLGFASEKQEFEEPVAAPKDSCPLEVALPPGSLPASPRFCLGPQHHHK